MKILAWTGLIFMILSTLVNLNSVFTDKSKKSDRILYFIGAIIYASLTYFFYLYLFGGR